MLDAELQMTFLRSANLIDLLEGFVIKDDIAVVSDEELASWLHQGIQDVLAKQQTTARGE